MDERDEVTELSEALRAAGVEVGSVGGENFRDTVARRLLGSAWLERKRMEAAAQALDDAAASIYNGAGDPEQALYDASASPWLTLRAMTMRAAFVLKQRQERHRD